MRVTVHPDGAQLFPGGSCAATRPFLGHSTLNCVSSEVTTWKPALLRSDSAFPRDSQTTSGTVTFVGPADTTRSTVEPLSTVWSAEGFWSMTCPTGAESGCGDTRPTFSPASVIAVFASSSVIPTTLGTGTCFGALPTVIVTVSPVSKSVPGSGLCLMTSPTSAWLAVTWNSGGTSQPASL